jgi:hypothetical protein
MTQVNVSLEKALQKKERGGGLQVYFPDDNYVTNIRTSICKKA